jgi:polysaccharide export outer membrane protein
MKQIVFSFTMALSLCVTAERLSAQPAPSPGSIQSQQSRAVAYRLGPRDLIDIKVFEVEELNVERRIAETGTVNLPLVGDVTVGGMTEVQAAQAIKKELEAKLLQRASVSVQVREFRARPISVIGAVRQPGNLEFSGRWTLLEALTAAGGVAENHGNVVYILRRADSGLSDQIAIDLNELLVRANPRVNIPLFANDLINVPVSVTVTVYCLGEVARPGAQTFKSTDRVSLLAAISQAGGLTDRAASKISIKRNQGSTPVELAADYKRIVAGKEPDVELREGDVILVKESFF